MVVWIEVFELEDRNPERRCRGQGRGLNWYVVTGFYMNIQILPSPERCGTHVSRRHVNFPVCVIGIRVWKRSCRVPRRRDGIRLREAASFPLRETATQKRNQKLNPGLVALPSTSTWELSVVGGTFIDVEAA